MQRGPVLVSSLLLNDFAQLLHKMRKMYVSVVLSFRNDLVYIQSERQQTWSSVKKMCCWNSTGRVVWPSSCAQGPPVIFPTVAVVVSSSSWSKSRWVLRRAYKNRWYSLLRLRQNTLGYCVTYSCMFLLSHSWHSSRFPAGTRAPVLYFRYTRSLRRIKRCFFICVPIPRFFL